MHFFASGFLYKNVFCIFPYILQIIRSEWSFLDSFKIYSKEVCLMSNLFPTNRDFFFPQSHLFDQTFDSFFSKMSHPSSDIVEKENCFEVKMDIPGMKKENIHVSYHNNVLTVEASQRHELENKDESSNFIHRERTSRSFRRQFIINHVQYDNIECKYEDGVLNITLPKMKQETFDKGHRIEVQ